MEYCLENIPQGERSNILGADAESEIIRALNDKDNLILWNDFESNKHLLKTSNFHIFSQIMCETDLIIGVDKLELVEASDIIPLLKNGGKPKTDVTVIIKTSQSMIVRNISVKNTIAHKVSIHEGYVSDLIVALGLKEEDNLANALKKFQECGSEQELQRLYPNEAITLKTELRNYNKELIDFFFFGKNSPLINDTRQEANMILYLNKLYVCDSKTYAKKYIKQFVNKGQFGTPFQWTYPSKKIGKKIQIKGFTNN